MNGTIKAHTSMNHMNGLMMPVATQIAIVAGHARMPPRHAVPTALNGLGRWSPGMDCYRARMWGRQ